MEIKVDEEAAVIATDLKNETEAMPLGALTARYRDLYDEIEITNKKLSRLKKEREALDTILYDAMLADGVEKMTTGDGSFRAIMEPRCSTASGREDVLFEALEERGLGGNIKRKVEWQTLNKLFRNGELEGLDDDGGPLISWERKKIGIRRASGTMP